MLKARSALVSRLAWRLLWRDRRRAGAMLLAMMVPLVAIVAATTALASGKSSVEARVAELIGTADTLVIRDELPSDVGSWAEAAQAKPRWLGDAPATPEVLSSAIEVSSGTRPAVAELVGLDLASPLTNGRVLWDAGAAPTDPDGVVLSNALATSLGVVTGDVVRVGASAAPMDVTGIVRRVSSTQARFVVATPARAGEFLDLGATLEGDSFATASARGQVGWYVSGEVDLPAAAAGEGWSTLDRDLARRVAGEMGIGGLVDAGEVAGIVLAGATLVLAEVALIFFALFAVVAQRRRRLLALLGVAGAPAAVRRQIISFQGAWLGLVSVVLALPLGVIAGGLLAGRVAATRNEVASELVVVWPVLALVTVAGVGLCWVASRLAARQVGVDLISALADRPPPVSDRRRRSARWTALGLLLLALVALGMGLDLGMTGVMAGVLLLVAAAVVGMQPLVGSLGDKVRGTVAMRTGTRLTSRSGGRTTAVIAVVASLVALGGVFIVGFSGLAARAEATYEPQVPLGAGVVEMTRPVGPVTVDAVGDALDGPAPVSMWTPVPPPPDEEFDDWGAWTASPGSSSCGAGPSAEECRLHEGRVALIEAQDIARLPIGGADVTPLVDHLQAGGAVVLHGRVATGATLAFVAPDDDGDQQGSLPAIAVGAPKYLALPNVFISPVGLERLGGQVSDQFQILYMPSRVDLPTSEQEDQVRLVLSADIGSSFFNYEVERGSDHARVVWRGTLLAAAILLLVVTTLSAIAIAMVSAEIRPDLTSLAAAGADARVRSAVTAHHASHLAIGGSLIGLVVVAIASPFSLAAMDGGPTPRPWIHLLIVCALVGLTSWVTGSIAGRRLSLMTRRPD